MTYPCIPSSLRRKSRKAGIAWCGLRRPRQAVYVRHARRRPGPHKYEFDGINTVRNFALRSMHVD